MKPMSNVAINRLQKQLQEKVGTFLKLWAARNKLSFCPDLSNEEIIEIAMGDQKFEAGLKRHFKEASFLYISNFKDVSPAVARAIRNNGQKNRHYFHMKDVFETFLNKCVSVIMDTAVFGGDWAEVKRKFDYFNSLEDKINESDLSCSWDQHLSELRGREHVEGLCE